MFKKKVDLRRAMATLMVPTVIVIITGVVTAQPLAEHSKLTGAAVNDCGVTIVVKKIETSSKDNRPITYNLINHGAKRIRTILVAEGPGFREGGVYFSAYLMPGEMHAAMLGNAGWRGGADAGKIAEVDIVLYEDGTTCGKNVSGQADWVTGNYEGEKQALRDMRDLIDRDLLGLETLAQLVSALDKKDGKEIKSDKWKTAYRWGYTRFIDIVKGSFDNDGIRGARGKLEAIESGLVASN